MNTYSKPIILCLLILSVISGLIWELNPLPSARDRLKNVPLKGLKFSGKPLPLTDAEQRALGEAHAIKRLYIYQGKQFIITLTDGSRNRNAVHDPTYCFLGDGWTIGEDSALRLDNGEARQLYLHRADESMQVLYWFSDGKQSYSSILNYWANTTLRRLTMGKSGEEPVLVLLRPVNSSHVNWDAVAHHFIPLLGL